ncbi:MAG: ABC transporter permease [Bacteroidales bacterium]|nr:ABC transporter permease [Bacteroidales bacterium]
MFRNYLLSALRNFSKARFYSSLNILGLSLGFAAVILILLYVNDEFSYDKHHQNNKQIYRIESRFKIGDMDDRFAIVPMPMAPAFKLEFPEVKEMVRFARLEDVLIKTAVNQEYYENEFYYADSTVFNVFTHRFLMGTAEHALNEPNTIVLTESLAKKYFGKNNPIGEVLQTGLGHPVKVTAVIADLPGNSHLRYRALISMISAAGDNVAEFNSFEPVAFWNIGVYGYVLLNDNSTPATILEKFPAFYTKYMEPVGKQINATFSPGLTNLSDIHLSGGLKADKPSGNISYLYIFLAIGLFILLLASINYMNMATARSARRAREVGIRKVAGAQKSQLMVQFLAESVLMVFIALFIALALVQLLLPEFNTLSGKEIYFNLITQFSFLSKLIGIALIVGIVSGLYPAFYLSSFVPVKVLKGTFLSNGKKSGMLRKGLVVFQFWIAFVLIIGTLVVGDQLSFLRKKDLGFKQNNLVVLQMQDTAFRNRVVPFKEALLTNPSIVGVTNATGVPAMSPTLTVMRIETKEGWEEQALMWTQTDYDYLDVLGLSLVNGRNFDKSMGTDKEEAVIINEACARKFDWVDDPIGKKIHFGFDVDGTGGRILKVIGVVKDFHVNSLHNVIEPYLIMISPVPRFLLTIRVRENELPSALAHMSNEWTRFANGRPFDYKILTDRLSDQYTAEQKISKLFRLASILTIFIALLGLLGLSSFVAEQKTKQIGIRKVLGGTTQSLLAMLYKEFSLLIVIAFVMAVPFAWWRLSLWLDSAFVYHTDIRAITFVVAGLLASLAGFLTISFHLVKVVLANPVETIKYE